MKYKAAAIGNPRAPKEPKKWYAKMVIDGEASLGEIVKEIEKFSALSEPDIYGVIIALENVIQNKLAEGKIVRFERLGSLYPSLSSHPSDTEKEVSAANIKKLKVNYRAGKRILEAMENAHKEKVK